MHGKAEKKVEDTFLTCLEAEPALIWRLIKALLHTEQCGVWKVLVQRDEGKRFIVPFLCLCKMFVKREKPCSAVQDAEKLTDLKSWTLTVWKFYSTSRERAIELPWHTLKKTCNLIICFHVFVRPVCRKSRGDVWFRIQKKRRHSVRECYTFRGPTVRVENACLNVNVVW